MNRRPQLFDCSIAGRPVRIQPRSGNILEPGRPYVSCSERDCQYVDLNRPPCPVRVGMFQDFREVQAVLADVLRTAGRPVCYACLIGRLGLSHSAVRSAAALLVTDAGAKIAPARCIHCSRRAITIQIRKPPELCAWPAASSPDVDGPRAAMRVDMSADGARVLRVLQTLRGDAWCTGCVALAAAIPLSAAQREIAALGVGGAVSLDPDGLCCRCGRSHPAAKIAGPRVNGARPGA